MASKTQRGRRLSDEHGERRCGRLVRALALAFTWPSRSTPPIAKALPREVVGRAVDGHARRSVAQCWLSRARDPRSKPRSGPRGLHRRRHLRRAWGGQGVGGSLCGAVLERVARSVANARASARARPVRGPLANLGQNEWRPSRGGWRTASFGFVGNAVAAPRPRYELGFGRKCGTQVFQMDGAWLLIACQRPRAGLAEPGQSFGAVLLFHVKQPCRFGRRRAWMRRPRATVISGPPCAHRGLERAQWSQVAVKQSLSHPAARGRELALAVRSRAPHGLKVDGSAVWWGSCRR